MDISLSRGLSKTTRSRFESAPAVVAPPPRWLRLDPRRKSELKRYVERFCDTLQPRAVSFLARYLDNQLLHSYFVLREARDVHQAHGLRETGYALRWVGIELFEKGNPDAWDVTLPLVIGKHAFDRLHQRFGDALFAQTKVYSDGFADGLLYALNSACLVCGPAWNTARAYGEREVALPLADGALVCDVTDTHLLARTCLTGAQLTGAQREQRALLLRLEEVLKESGELVACLRSFESHGPAVAH
jgi:hypothetical protein